MSTQVSSSLNLAIVASFKKKPRGNPGDVIFYKENNRIRIYGSNLGKYTKIQDKVTLEHILDSLRSILSDSAQDYQLLMSHAIKGGFGSVFWDSSKDQALIVGDIETRFYATLNGVNMLRHVYYSLKNFQRDF